MLKTTAKVKHRDYVPYGWFAFEFCHVDFYGFRAEEMKRKWREIEHQRFIKYQSLYEENKMKIENLRNKSYAILEVVRTSKPFYRFWYNKAEKAMISDAKIFSSQADTLERENEEVEDLRFFGTYECHRKIEDLLRQNGFVLTSTSSRGDECIVDIEVWTLEE